MKSHHKKEINEKSGINGGEFTFDTQINLRANAAMGAQGDVMNGTLALTLQKLPDPTYSVKSEISLLQSNGSYKWLDPVTEVEDKDPGTAIIAWL